MQGVLTPSSRLGPFLPMQRVRSSVRVPYAFKSGRHVGGRCSSLAHPGRLMHAAAGPEVQAPIVAADCTPAASIVPQELFSLAEGLETPIQLIYLVTLLGFLAVGAYLVVRQVLIRRELDEGAKGLGERIRTGEATCEDYYELGVILTRKKLYTQATKNLEKAKKVWDGEESELAQVHNALGFCYFNMEKTDLAIQEYQRAVELQPGYVTAWNNLGDALEKKGKWRDALQAYQEALTYAPDNRIARQRSDYCKEKVTRLAL
ncbi:hypothetical protein Vretimale_3912 [Volvox reticuliferus]|uniref:Uncharacterized protein n=2 Tax=Volvox reticuliferus TaxID=1737510 RepID=A0A8J4G3X1_9CHLO|nr:hypothetical protein Vretimale_3912 [Volvox reticuliferus]